LSTTKSHMTRPGLEPRTAVASQWLTAWAMARPLLLVTTRLNLYVFTLVPSYHHLQFIFTFNYICSFFLPLLFILVSDCPNTYFSTDVSKPLVYNLVPPDVFYGFVQEKKRLEMWYVITSLNHSWSWALLENLPIVQLLKNFSAFYGMRRFITVFTRALHWSLSRVRSI
jgi:hypothetical protein